MPNDEPPQLSQAWTCECGCTCPRCGLLTFEDRLAAFEAGRQQGVIEGRLQRVSEDVAALEDIAHLVGFIRDRAIVAARDGENCAETYVPRTDSWAVGR